MATPGDQQDPLTASLPPETDYITYLTLLEYQLTASNLPTLTRLLTEDDGTLAQEIGWDLLKLVLPLTTAVPHEARKCLEVVARRGNPREVVVRVAEELEKLGRDDGDSGETEQEDGDGEDDGLRTFDGEAERIHLGNMTLDGMPPPSDRKQRSQQQAAQHQDQLDDHATNQDTSVTLCLMLSMLSLLHPRIKTKYPSRFLATSLPAALGAYRRLPIDAATTTTFLSFLERLAGKQKPALPPRMSSTIVQQANESTSASTPLPDPEGQSEEAVPPEVSTEEQAIIRRLLQAVLLEVLEECIQSLAVGDTPCMSWTMRLRDRFEPKRLVPGRQTETEKWEAQESLTERALIVKRAIRLSQDLGIEISDLRSELFDFEEVLAGDDNEAPGEDAGQDSPTEFPRSPKDIPFPHLGLVFLYVARYFDGIISDDEAVIKAVDVPEFLPQLGDLFRHHALKSSELSLGASTPVLDALFALIYASRQPGRYQVISDSTDYVSCLRLMAELSADIPDPQMRDCAHAVATTLFHQMGNVSQKIGLLSSLFGRQEPINLQSVAVNWLKDGLLAFMSNTSSEVDDKTSLGVASGMTASIPSSALCMDISLSAGLFLWKYSGPSPDPFTDLLQCASFYISMLNLLRILVVTNVLRTGLVATTPDEPGMVISGGEFLLEAAKTVVKLNALSNQAQRRVEESSLEPLEKMELWSLCDAAVKTREGFEKHAPETYKRALDGM